MPPELARQTSEAEDIAPPSPRRGLPGRTWDRVWKQGRGGDWHYVKQTRLPWPTAAMVLAILVLTLADGVMTLLLIDHPHEEANPLMRWLLGIHPMAFVIGKYVLTAACLPFLLIFGRRQVFLPGLRVAHVLPATVMLYGLLIVCQAAALRWTWSFR